MDRKRTAEDGRRNAEENGFEDDDTDIDDNPIPRDVLEYTRDMMSRWNCGSSTSLRLVTLRFLVR